MNRKYKQFFLLDDLKGTFGLISSLKVKNFSFVHFYVNIKGVIKNNTINYSFRFNSLNDSS